MKREQGSWNLGMYLDNWAAKRDKTELVLEPPFCVHMHPLSIQGVSSCAPGMGHIYT
jgi:hypothetical protein